VVAFVILAPAGRDSALGGWTDRSGYCADALAAVRSQGAPQTLGCLVLAVRKLDVSCFESLFGLESAFYAELFKNEANVNLYSAFG
jgi:hypothetical protein